MDQLKSANIRVELDDKSEPLGAGSAMPKCQKIPYMLILGGKEEQVEQSLSAPEAVKTTVNSRLKNS